MTDGRLWRLGLVAMLLIAALPIVPAAAAPPGNVYFERTWARTDRPVADGQVNRTWMWGPEGFTGVVQEPFRESPGGVRQVQYFDKSRMEISDVGEDPSSIWYVTNGLLVVEMMTGRLQTGLSSWEQRQPAQVNVAGDANDLLGATYQYFGYLTDLAPLAVGTVIHQIVSPGSATNLFMYNERFNTYGVTAATYVPETNHTVASVFWDFMTSSGVVIQGGGSFHAPLFENAFYATGLPVTEAYWATVKVGGVETDVLIQCFERRCLTYTPSNSVGWQVEAGNVGQHYHAWRYGNRPIEDPTPPPIPSPPQSNVLPEMILTDYYVNPDLVVASYRAAKGLPVGPQTSDFARRMYEIGYFLPGLYSMATSEQGVFNHDTRNFRDWAFLQLGWYDGSYEGPNPSDFQHVCGQAFMSLHVPESNMAKRLQQFERNVSTFPSRESAAAYWYFSVGPIVYWWGNPISRDALTRAFDNLLYEYMSWEIAQPGDRGFAAFAAATGFTPYLCQ